MLSDEDVCSGKYSASFLAYFERFSQTEPLFLPELNAAKKIVEFMRAEDRDFDCISAIIKELQAINDIQHYDGSGWHGFKNSVKMWLDSRGVKL